MHAYGAAFDNPDLLVCCVVGDGEAETGPLAASWHSNKFLNPVTDGAVLPILHLNGYKIANPTVLARIPESELRSLMEGYGYSPRFLTGSDPEEMHQLMAATMDEVTQEIADIQSRARSGGATERPLWPMIVLRTPKGWTGPKIVDGKQAEGTFRSHQVPIAELKTPEHLAQLESWMRSYRPEELFDEGGALRPDLAALAPEGPRRMGANPHANGGLLLHDLELPDFRDFAVPVPEPGTSSSEATRVLGHFMREVIRSNPETFRLMGPDETASNRLGDVLEVTDRAWDAQTLDSDDHLAPDGRVMEVLSEHLCQGWLEGYLLTGRHGLFNCYEAFIHIIDSMFNQHAKWLKVTDGIPWRAPIASLNYCSPRTCGAGPQRVLTPGPGLHRPRGQQEGRDRAGVPAAGCELPALGGRPLPAQPRIRQRDRGRQAARPGLPRHGAGRRTLHPRHRSLGLGQQRRGHRAGRRARLRRGHPDARDSRRRGHPAHELPQLKVRVVNVVDLMRLQPEREHPHGLSDKEFDSLFTSERPVIFAYHGYPWLIHRLTYRRANHHNLHVRGYKEEGTTTTPFDMVMLNDLDRFHLVIDVIDRVPELGERASHLRQRMTDERLRHRAYTREHGDDPPELRHWVWPYPSGQEAAPAANPQG